VLASSGGVESDPETVARELRQRARDGRISPFNPESSARPTLAFPIPGSPPGSDCDWLLFESRSDGPPGQFETHLTKSCASVCGLHRMKSEAGLQTERRIGADLLRAALEGEASPRETASKLDALELGHDVAVLAFASGEPQDAVRLLESEARRRDLAAVIATGTPLDPALACVVLGEASGDPVREAGRLLEVLRETEPTARVGVSSPRPGAELARAFHEARASLMADAMSPDPPPVATRDDLGALSLIFAMSEDDSLRTFVSTVLEPIGDPEDPFTQELLHSLEVFLDCNGGWEKASRKLYCHRHTLRYRMNRIEELTGRDLGRVRDRFDFWLALKFRGMAIGAATKA